MVINRLAVILLLMASYCMSQESPSGNVGMVTDIPENHLIKKVQPRFPHDFKPSRRFDGTVVLKLTINTAGEPEGFRVVKGDRQLAAAAVEAVKQWRWEPLKLNGKPVGVDTMITVIFEPKSFSDSR